ncbi:MAG: hypothetical protein VKJ06_07055, partial [Vampirovibrionales bacterium]|nr:hypothetical protein [Vampirovibrionales bacterium]
EAKAIAENLTGKFKHKAVNVAAAPTATSQNYDNDWWFGPADNELKKIMVNGDRVLYQKPVNAAINWERKQATDFRNWLGRTLDGDKHVPIAYPWEKPGFVQPAEAARLPIGAATLASFGVDGWTHLAYNHGLLETATAAMPGIKSAAATVANHIPNPAISAGNNPNGFINAIGKLFNRGASEVA